MRWYGWCALNTQDRSEALDEMLHMPMLIRVSHAPILQMRKVRLRELKWSPAACGDTRVRPRALFLYSPHSVTTLHFLTPPSSTAQRASLRSLQEYFPQFILQGCSPWLQRIDMIGPSAETLGSILKNQYWLLQEAALPRANWGPYEHFQNCGHDHLCCWLPCPNADLQPVTFIWSLLSKKTQLPLPCYSSI